MLPIRGVQERRAGDVRGGRRGAGRPHRRRADSDGEGIRIFQIHSPKLKEYEHERWIDVTWDIDPDNPERFPAKIIVTALNEPGTLAQIAQVIGEADGNIDNVRMVRRAPTSPRCTIELEVWDLDHLNQIIAGLKSKRWSARSSGCSARARARSSATIRDLDAERRHGRPARRSSRPLPPAHLRLGVNIDHVATIRNARGGRHPDPLRAAHLAVEAGADGITAHLREDRRHISDDDIARLKRELTRPLNLEMAATDEMLAIALRHVPHACCLVPEKREERTTEGGLDVVARREPPAPRRRAR